MSTKEKIGLFYGSSTCYTEIIAEKLQGLLSDYQVDVHNIKDTPLSTAEDYKILIFGISTWDFGEIQEDWEANWQDIATTNLDGKIVGLYGLGDQEGYTDWFQDALGMLYEEVMVHQVDIVGLWPNQGYDFNASKALLEGNEYFVGLALDEDCQYDLTDERLINWSEQICAEIDELIQ